MHLHSPGVTSFRFPAGLDPKTAAGRRRIAEAYVGRLRELRIELGAITDYNGIRTDWFQLLHEVAKQQGITLLPGVEVSFDSPKYGLHVLAIFRAEEDLDQINNFLRGEDEDSSRPLFSPSDHRDLDSDPEKVLSRIRERFGCLLILPHPDQDNGFLKSMKVRKAAQFTNNLRPDAFDHLKAQDLERLKASLRTSGIQPDWLDRIAQVEFSDPKCIEEIGKKEKQDGTLRATFLKLSATDLEAIRLALHDPKTRLCVGNVPPSLHARIRSMVVTGSGFLGNLAINWNDDLNVIIGGRGVGKSAILETLRYAFSMEPYSDQPYREELVRHALGSGGKVEILVERPLGNGKAGQYRVTRVWGEETRVTEVDSLKLVAMPPQDLLGPNGGPTIFGQREIYAVSGSEEYRLALLDDLIGEEARHHADAVRQALERLRSNARSILEARERLTKREEYRQRLHAIEHELEIYEKHGAVLKLKEASHLRGDAQRLRSASDVVSKAQQYWEEIQDNLLPPLARAQRNLQKGQSKQKVVLEEASKVLEVLEGGLRRILERGGVLFQEAAKNLGDLATRWADALRPLEEEINRIKREAQTDALDPDRLLRLTEERTALVPLIDELNRNEDRLKQLLEKRQELLSHVRERRLAEHRLRREKADGITLLLQGRLRLQVEFKGQTEDYKRKLGTVLKGSGLSQDAIEHLVRPDATDGIALAESVRSGVDEVQERFNLTQAMAERLVRWLSADESRLFDVETLIPLDALRVELKVDNEYRALDRLSVGQRATAVLLLLFALEGRVLVLDQPEDDLDNRFVYEDIVQILREQKGLQNSRRRRQIIAATHNANIPVIGDAELVLAMEAQANRTRVVGRASIDAAWVRELIKTVMEGGEEAFLRRAEKYGGPRHGASRTV